MRRRWVAVAAVVYAAVAVAAFWLLRPRHWFCVDGMDIATGREWGYCGDEIVSVGAVIGTVAVAGALLAFLVVRRRPAAPRLLPVLGAAVLLAPVIGFVVGALVDPFPDGPRI